MRDDPFVLTSTARSPRDFAEVLLDYFVGTILPRTDCAREFKGSTSRMFLMPITRVLGGQGKGRSS